MRQLDVALFQISTLFALLFVTPANADGLALDLKGFVPGLMTREEAIAHAKSKGLSLSCDLELCLVVNQVTLAGRPMESFALFFDVGVLSRIMITGNTYDVSLAAMALKEKYGPPLEERQLHNETTKQFGMHYCWSDRVEDINDFCMGDTRLGVNTVSDYAGKGKIFLQHMPTLGAGIKLDDDRARAAKDDL